MSTETGIGGAILAGGKSQRMGQEKALLKFGEITLVEHAINTMKQVIPQPMIITNAPEKFKHLNLPLYKDIIPGSGPLGGLYTALEYSTKSHVLVLACDMPFVTSKIVQQLSDQGIGYDIVVLDAGFGVEPLCTVYSKRCIPFIKKQLDKGKLKVTDFYRSLKVKVLYLEESDNSISKDMFFNINTPADKLRAEQILKKRSAQTERNDRK